MKLPLRPFFYYARDGNPEAIRYGKWKLHLEKFRGWNEGKNGKFPVSLFDLESDIGESANLAEENPSIVKQLNEMLIEIDSEITIEQ